MNQTTSAPTSPVARYAWWRGGQAHRPWVAPLAIYIVTRAINAVMILVAGQHQIPRDEWRALHIGAMPADAPQPESLYLQVVVNWDGQWFEQIALHGYPTELPLKPDGTVAPNPWAFLPVFPAMCRAIMAVSGASFAVAAAILSLICGAVGVLAFAKFAATRLDQRTTLLAVAMICTFACTPILHLAYADGLALALVALTLTALHRGRVLRAGLLIALLALTRAVALPIAAVILLTTFVAWRQHRLDRRSLATRLVLAGWSVVCASIWPITAGLATDHADAYTATYAAWMTDLTKLPFFRFVDSFTPDERWLGYLTAIAFAVGVLYLATRTRGPVELRSWSFFYVGYVLSTVNWKPGALRYFLLAFPVLWLVLPPEKAVVRKPGPVAVYAYLVLSLIGQWLYVRYSLVISTEGLQVP